MGEQNLKSNLLLLLGTFVVLIVLLEVGLALFYPQPITKYTELVQFTQYDPQLGWSNIPNYYNERVICEEKKRFTTNAQGFRDLRDYTHENPEDKFRIIVLGDSFIWGEQQDDKETFPYYLQQELGDEYEVLNFGVSGYGPDQELMQLSEHVEHYKPDLVLVGFFQNDPINIMWNQVSGDPARAIKPVFKFEDGQLMIKNCCPVPQVTDKRDPPKQKSWLKNFHSFVFFQKKIHNIYETKSEPENKSFFESYTDNERIQMVNENYLVNSSADLGKSIPVLLALYDSMLEGESHYGYSMMIMNIPSNTQADPIMRQDFLNQFYDLEEKDLDRTKINRILKNWTSHKGVPYLDLLAAFEEGNEGDRNKYYPCNRDMHWNGLGAHRAAQEATSMIQAIYE